MKPFFHLEGWKTFKTPPGWLRTLLPSPQPAFILRLILHPPLHPHWRHLGCASPTGTEQLRAQHEELGASSRACQELRGRAGCEELPFASCLPSDLLERSAKYH